MDVSVFAISTVLRREIFYTFIYLFIFFFKKVLSQNDEDFGALPE